MAPFALRRNDVLMAHEQNGFFRRPALPVKEQIAVDFGFFKLGEPQRKQLRKRFMERAEFFRVVAASMGGRIDLNHFGKFFCQPQRFLFILLRLIIRCFFRAEQRPDDRDEYQQQQNARDQQQIFHTCASLLAFFFL